MPITDEDVLRELLHRATEDVHAPSAVTAGIVSRHRRRLRTTRILSITTTSVAAAAVLAALLVTRAGPPAPGRARNPAALPATELPPVKLTAVQVLDQLSVAAADTSQPAGRYIALTELDLYSGAGYPKNFLGEFLNPKPSAAQKQQLQQMVMEYGIERTTVFDAVTGDVWDYQRGAGVPGASPVVAHGSPTRAEFDAWPTNPAKLRALLIRQAGQTVNLDITGVRMTADDLVFQEATTWLWNPLLSPALRSAMYKVLAQTPGVTVTTGTTDSAGRPAIEISGSENFAGTVTTFESPVNGAMLEQDFPPDLGPAVYATVTGSATPPANPYRG
jgi:hypothetical protein